MNVCVCSVTNTIYNRPRRKEKMEIYSFSMSLYVFGDVLGQAKKKKKTFSNGWLQGRIIKSNGWPSNRTDLYFLYLYRVSCGCVRPSLSSRVGANENVAPTRVTESTFSDWPRCNANVNVNTGCSDLNTTVRRFRSTGSTSVRRSKCTYAPTRVCRTINVTPECGLTRRYVTNVMFNRPAAVFGSVYGRRTH